MTPTAAPSPLQTAENSPGGHRWLHALSLVTVVLSLILISSGGLVTGDEAGLAVPDWPTTFGYNMFSYPVSKMVQQTGVFLEHGHRLIASLVGLLTIALAAGLLYVKPRRWPGWLWMVPLIAVVAQGILGGLRVLRVNADFAVVHACLAQTYFAILVAVAVVTSSRWTDRVSKTAGSARPSLRALCVLALATAWLQVLAGALLRHGGRIAMANGRLHLHITGGVLVILTVGWVGVRVLRRHGDQPPLDRAARHTVFVLLLQLALGGAALVAVIVTQDSARPHHWAMLLVTTAHVVCGALLLGSLVVTTMLAFRLTGGAGSGATPAEDPPNPPDARGRATDFVALTKPRLTSLVLFTALVGFYLGSPGPVDLTMLFHAMVGIAAAAAGASALNQALEHDLDGRMRRTADRPVPAGRLTFRQAMIFGTGLTLAGVAYLLAATNLLAGALAALTVLSYLFAYTPLKKRTYLCTIIGAVPGAIPPLIGWAAAAGAVGLGAWILFAILFFWQVPHFYALARLYRLDYARAGLPMLPVVDPSGRRTARQTLLFLAALLPAAMLPTPAGLAGASYLAVAALLGAALFAVGTGLARYRNTLYARRLFVATIAYLPILLTMLMVDKAG